jgi:hypothetical protein
MVLLAAALTALTALGPARLLRGYVSAAPARAPRADARPARRRRARLLEHPYVTRLVLAAVMAAAVATLIDFAFKEAIAAHVPAHRLPAFLATFNLVTSALGLVVQLFGVGWLVRVAGVPRAPVLLPLLLLLAVVWTVLTGGLGAILLLRVLDSALRGALLRPSLELLQVPLGPSIRRKAKPLIDAVGQRSGQALAALALLLPWRLAAAPSVRMLMAVALLLAWTAIAVTLGRRYVGLLRSMLLTPGVPARRAVSVGLDDPTGATLVQALDSPRDGDVSVSAALDLLAATGQRRLIPLYLLDHPSPAVALRVLDALTSDTTRDRAGGGWRLGDGPCGRLLAALDRMQGHPSIAVRAAALRRRTTLAPDRHILTEAARDDGCPALRAVAWVALVARGWVDQPAGVGKLRGIAARGADDARRAMAQSIAESPSPVFQPVLLDLAAGRDAQSLGWVAAALGGLGDAAAVATLITLLGRREARAAARTALARAGHRAFDQAAAALSGADQPPMVRASLPRALVEIDPARAPRVLLDGLLVESDGVVRYRILRALNRLRRAQPRAVLDPDILGRAAVSAVESAYRYLTWRLFLDDGGERVTGRRTATWRLLRELLREKEDNAVERLFLVLALRYPRDDFRRLLPTLRGGGRRERAAGRELMENLLTGPALILTLALIDDVGDRERLAAMAGGAPPRAPAYRDLVAQIRGAEQGGTLAALATHHIDELTSSAARAEPATDGRDVRARVARA